MASFVHLMANLYSNLQSKLQDFAWPPCPRYYFVVGFIWALNHTTNCVIGFLYLRWIPTSMDTTDPNYTVQRAGDYRAWVNGRLFVVYLHAVCAVLTIVDCAMFTWWDFDRERRDGARDSDLQLRRWRVMFPEGERGHEGTMEAGFVHERPERKEHVI